MPLFFFDIHIVGRVLEDETGIDLPDQASAIRQGKRAFYELLVEEPSLRHGPAGIEIRDEAGKILVSDLASSVPSAVAWSETCRQERV